jgi:hypothetical protein
MNPTGTSKNQMLFMLSYLLWDHLAFVCQMSCERAYELCYFEMVFTEAFMAFIRFSIAGLKVDQCHMPTFIIHSRIVNYSKRISLAILWQRDWTRHEDGPLLLSEFLEAI